MLYLVQIGCVDSIKSLDVFIPFLLQSSGRDKHIISQSSALVNVHIYGLDIPMSSASSTSCTPVLEHIFYNLSPLEEFSTIVFSCSQSLQPIYFRSARYCTVGWTETAGNEKFADTYTHDQ